MVSKSKTTAGAAVLAGLVAGSTLGVFLRHAHVFGDKPDDADVEQALDGLTKKELYDRAREADIRGRSAMSKSELIAALGGTPG
jgi:hypothetical protein